jgi:Sec-independent protein secretion pathway component TatC
VALPLWLVVYLWQRGDRTTAPSTRERLARDWVGVVLVTFLVGSLFSPPDPVSQVVWAAPMLLVGAVVVGYRWTTHDGTPT